MCIFKELQKDRPSATPRERESCRDCINCFTVPDIDEMGHIVYDFYGNAKDGNFYGVELEAALSRELAKNRGGIVREMPFISDGWYLVKLDYSVPTGIELNFEPTTMTEYAHRHKKLKILLSEMQNNGFVTSKVGESTGLHIHVESDVLLSTYWTYMQIFIAIHKRFFCRFFRRGGGTSGIYGYFLSMHNILTQNKLKYPASDIEAKHCIDYFKSDSSNYRGLGFKQKCGIKTTEFRYPKATLHLLTFLAQVHLYDTLIKFFQEHGDRLHAHPHDLFRAATLGLFKKACMRDDILNQYIEQYMFHYFNIADAGVAWELLDKPADSFRNRFNKNNQEEKSICA